VDGYLWDDVIRGLSLPTSAEYGDTGEQYPVRYEFSIDGVDLDTTVNAEDALDVEVAIEGISPAVTNLNHDGDPLEWMIGQDGLDDLETVSSSGGHSELPSETTRSHSPWNVIFPTEQLESRANSSRPSEWDIRC